MKLHILAVACVAGFSAACGGSGPVVVGSAGAPEPTGAAAIASSSSSGGGSTLASRPHTRMPVEVWLDRDGRLWPVTRSINPTVAVVRAALTALLAGPNPAERAAGVETAVPSRTQILGISLHDGVATVDLTSEFGGGTAALERIRLAQLVYTVTQFPTVHALRLHLDGVPVSAFADGLVIPDPIRRTSMGFAALASPIVVSSPLPGEEVRAPLRVSGVADVFEAGLTYRLLDAGGRELGSGASSASCGTGCAGTFAFTIPELGVTHDEDGTLVVTSGNASGRPGGGQVVRVPLHLVAPTDVLRPLDGASVASPAVVSFRHPIAARMLVRVFDSHFRLLGKRSLTATCFGRCSSITYTARIPFVASGLQPGYVVVSPLHPHGDASDEVVEIPVTLNGG